MMRKVDKPVLINGGGVGWDGIISHGVFHNAIHEYGISSSVDVRYDSEQGGEFF